MASLGNLFVTLGAKTKGLDDAVDSSKSKLGSLASVAKSTTAVLGSLGIAAGLAGGAIIANLVNSGRLAIDTQAKLAQALDGTIGGLRAAEMAAGDAGVATEEFYSAAKRMNAALGDATKQTGPAYEALDKLGLSAQRLLSLDIDQRFAAIADAMNKQNVSGAQAQDIMRDLGVRSENLANLIRQGGDAFREQADEVDRLGLRLSMIDAAQVEMANDSLGIFGDVLTGIQDRLTVASAPYITVLAEKFRELAVENNGFREQIESTIKTIITGFGYAADVVRGLEVVFKGVEAAGRIMFSRLLKGINLFINPFNIDAISNSPLVQGLRNMSDEAAKGVEETIAELDALTMKEMPSDNVRKFLDEVAQASKRAAAETVKARQTIMGGMSAPGIVDTGDKKQQEQFRKEMQAWNEKNASELESIKQRYVTEEQLLQEHREIMNIIGEEYDQAKFETEEQWRSVREQAEAEHLARMTELNRSAYDGIANLINQRWGNIAASTAGAIKSIVGTMATGSRKAFEVSKAWALADALVSTYQGIAAGVRLGWPQGIPAVAWAAANGFAQVTAIRNQQFGGAGGAAASGNGTPGAAPNPVGVGGSASGAGGGQGGQTLIVAPIDPNAIFSGSAMQQFGQRIYDYSKDGGKVVFNA